MNLKGDEYEVLHMGLNNPIWQYRMGTTRLSRSLVGKDKGIVVDSK